MSHSILTLIQEVEALLPQTQCERCGHPGCRPYAESVVRNRETVAGCFPGGQATADAIAAKLGRKREFVEEQPGPKLLAKVIEQDCIGCTKCIQACPVDAIVGASKQMHTVLVTECTGCELCLPACPMDCIVMEPTQDPSWIVEQPASIQAQADYAKYRFNSRKQRLNKQKGLRAKTRTSKTNVDIQQAIQASIARAQTKRIKSHERTEKTGNL